MKRGKRQKPHGIKHKILEEKKKEQRIGLAVTIAILIALIFVSGFLINSMLKQPSTNPTSQTSSTSEPSEPRAAIVDHLSLTYPNQTFIETATDTLKQAGYTVDYYTGEQVTVEFYRKLPTHDYRVIILRVHSGLALGTTELDLFTSEPYSKTKYVYEQLTKQILQAFYSEGGPTYFAISPNFVKSSMNGKFQNTVVIMMGCNGLTYTNTAEAFIEKGAKVYISWTKPVLAPHADSATSDLLRHFLIEKRTLKESVQETFKEVGPDPSYKSLLIYYPLRVGDQTIEDIKGNPKTKP